MKSLVDSLKSLVDSFRRYWWAWVGGTAIFVVSTFTDWIDEIVRNL